LKKETTFTFPKELKPYEKALEHTILPFIKIKEQLDKEPKIFESKFGGNPYLPKEAEHPINSYGAPMLLLAQINFSEVPNIKDMPEKGILQFFITGKEEIDYGQDPDNITSQKNFRVIYYNNVITEETQLTTDFSYINEYNLDFDMFPIQREIGLSFEINKEPLSCEDYRFEELCETNKSINSLWKNDDDFDLYSELYGRGHKVGGYCYFTQTDPRVYSDELREYDVLLLQIDSDENEAGDIMFGDAGVANFFIKKEDLKKLSFKDVLYNWDCS